MEIQTYPWESMEIHGNPWMSKDVYGYPGALVFCQSEVEFSGLVARGFAGESVGAKVLRFMMHFHG